MTPEIITVGDVVYKLPMFDPMVAAHFQNSASHTDTLLHEINVAGIYRPLFETRKDLVFLDIGANIGLVSIYALPACQRIVALEPARETFEVLRAITTKHPEIELVQAALSHFDGEVEFFVNDINSTASSTVNTHGIRTTVRGMTLSSILSIYQLEHVDVCKIDAEGAEGASLSFGQLEIASKVVDTWYIETHNCPRTTWNLKLGKLVERLSRLGYHDMKIDGMTLRARRK